MPIHQARDWQKASRWLEKEMKIMSWHMGSDNQVFAPLIIDPASGDLTSRLREACTRALEEAGIRVTVRERAGRKMKADCKPEPLRVGEKTASAVWLENQKDVRETLNGM